MISWINILHLYQPPTQSKEVVDRVVAESYSTILNLLGTYPDLRLTINLSGSLIELLEKYGHQAIIEGFKKYAANGQVELLGSAMYHPILPFLPLKEIERQINLNTNILRKHFKKDFPKKGFYIPEMAYSEKIAGPIKECGFDWIALDEIHSVEPIDPSIRYTGEAGLGIIFRNSQFSKSFPPEFIVEQKSKIKGGYIITAHDGELYGHWHKDDRGYYKKAFTDTDIKTMLASEYLSKLTETRNISVREASWESTSEELGNNIPYGLWHHPGNEIHKKLETLKKFVLRTVEKNRENSYYRSARAHADKGLASCAWWWSSEKKLGAFSVLTWNPEEIEKGAQELLTAVRALKTIDPASYLRAESLFNKVHAAVWERHWKQHPEG
jgi:predicted glycosyl hydrolase (DUF1957 family)